MPELTNKAKHVGNSRSWPVKALAWFILVTVALFSLILFTGDRQAAPRLGIDLQGGTRVTLVPQGDEPTQDQLDQARAILEQRVNGMGVSGAQVVADGNTLVITVPGEGPGCWSDFSVVVPSGCPTANSKPSKIG